MNQVNIDYINYNACHLNNGRGMSFLHDSQPFDNWESNWDTQFFISPVKKNISNFPCFLLNPGKKSNNAVYKCHGTYMVT